MVFPLIRLLHQRPPLLSGHTVVFPLIRLPFHQKSPLLSGHTVVLPLIRLLHQRPPLLSGHTVVLPLIRLLHQSPPLLSGHTVVLPLIRLLQSEATSLIRPYCGPPSYKTPSIRGHLFYQAILWSSLLLDSFHQRPPLLSGHTVVFPLIRLLPPEATSFIRPYCGLPSYKTPLPPEVTSFIRPYCGPPSYKTPSTEATSFIRPYCGLPSYKTPSTRGHLFYQAILWSSLL